MYTQSNGRAVNWSGVPVLLSLIAVPVAMAIHSYRPANLTDWAAPFVYAAPVCGYAVKIDADGTLAATDLPSVERVGLFECHPDGTVQLTTAEGFAPVANDCIRRAGYEDRIGTIPDYMRPAT